MYKHFFKRAIDFTVALVALLIIWPILLVVAIWLHFANKPTASPQPSPKGKGEASPLPSPKGKGVDVAPWWSNAFFTQERPGLHGKIFKVIKFKTMTDERDADGNLLPESVRLTPVGSIIRKTSIDELPQLINVLKGDMSLIGPRPLLPKYLPLYNDEQRRRHDVRPGITGWAQVNGRNNISWTEKFKLDVWYVDNCSLWIDIKIIFLTIKNVLSSKDIVLTTGPFTGNN